MKPAWDALAQKYEGSDKVLIADVDCTAAGEPLCSRFSVQGFPTIKVFSPPDEEGEDYDGGRDEESLAAFAAAMGPGCSVDTKDNCSEEQLKELTALLEMSEAERQAELEDLATSLKKKEEDHEALLKSLQAQYEESNQAVEDFKKTSKPRIKLLKSSMAKPKVEADTAAKDEM